MASAALFTSLSISIFGCNALTSSLRRNARTFTTYDISVMVLLSATSINARRATLPDVSLPRATGNAALSSSPAFDRLGFFVSRSRTAAAPAPSRAFEKLGPHRRSAAKRLADTGERGHGNLIHS